MHDCGWLAFVRHPRPIHRSDTGLSKMSDGQGPVAMPGIAKGFTFNGSPNGAT